MVTWVTLAVSFPRTELERLRLGAGDGAVLPDWDLEEAGLGGDGPGEGLSGTESQPGREGGHEGREEGG